MILVERLAVQHGLDRLAVVVRSGLIVTAGEFLDVAVLPHVEVQPLAVHFRVLGREQRLIVLYPVVPVPSPGRQKATAWMTVKPLRARFSR